MRMVRGPTPVFDPQAFLVIVGSEKLFSNPCVSSTISITPIPCFSAQIHTPGSAELVNKASLKYFPLQVHFSLRALPEGRDLASKVKNSCI
jgi:hypothetical protein